MPSVKAHFLKSGDTIGVIAPGEYSSSRSEMQVGRELLEQHGFKVVFGDHVGDRYGYFAGTDEDRASDFNIMWADPQVKAILCWGTVWGAARILPYVDFDVIRSTPKLFIGWGSATSLHLAIAKEADLVTLHAPDFSAFYRSPYTFEAFIGAITSSEPSGDVGQPPRSAGVLHDDPPLVSYRDGTATGTLVGGSLPAIVGSLGTPHEIDTVGKILLLEARNLRTYTIERYLTALWLSGKFQDAAGVIVSECVNCVAGKDENNTFSLEEVLENRLPMLPIPSLSGLRIGQGRDTQPVPLGVTVTLDSTKRTLYVHDSAVAKG